MIRAGKEAGPYIQHRWRDKPKPGLQADVLSAIPVVVERLLRQQARLLHSCMHNRG